GPSREDKRRQIATALQGRTPYAVEDLVFDWSGKGSVVRVAVVARETLEEAEGFATAHRLNPVSFVAIPDEGTFVGEAWFGPANSADAVLAPGETVDRDREAVTIIPLAKPDPRAEQDPDELLAPTEPPPDDDIDSLPGLAEALAAASIETDLAAGLGADGDVPADAAGDPTETDPVLPDEAAAAGQDDPLTDPVSNTALTDLLDEAAPDPVDPPVSPEAEASTDLGLPAASEAGSRTEPPSEAKAPDPVPTAPVEPDEAPFADVTDDSEPEEVASVGGPVGSARVLASDILDDDLPPAPSAAAMIAFSSRRSASVGGGKAVPPVTTGSGGVAGPRPSAFSGAVRDGVAKKPFGAAVTAPSIPGARGKSPLKPGSGPIPRPVPPGPTTVKSPARPNGTFGAAPVKRGRTGFTFMLLIGLLLLSLALVAAWASFFLTQAANNAGSSPPTDVVEVPLIEDEMAADLQDPEDFAAVEDPVLSEPVDPVASAEADLEALAVEEAPVNIGGDTTGSPPESSVAATMAETAAPGDPAAGTEADLAGDAEGSGEPPPASTIATDVTGSRVPVEDQDEIFLAAMDAPPPVLDAFALPAPAATTDTPPGAPMPPPAFGTVYKFDALGLLVPTPEGILSPEGIMLFAGPPPLAPPARSASAVAAAAEAAAAAQTAEAPAAEALIPSDPAAAAASASLVTAGDDAEAAALESPVPSDPAMAGFRPKPRPEGLVPSTDDGAVLDTGVGTDVVSLRPLARPVSVAAAAAAANPDQTAENLGAQGASLTAQAEAQRAAAEALEAANPSVVAISMRPSARPSDLSRAVEAAVAAAVREPDPAADAEVELAAADRSPEENAEIDEPEAEGAAPAIPTKASVAKQATYQNAISLSKTSLIGIFGTSSKPYALIRTQAGKYKKVKVGDKVDGGVVKAITENEVRYQKGGKLVTLKMPKA
ncbi:MAG: hypothetical protein JNN02_07665, partial [Tabrizicola sp.]|nr:hypothetical protein [Tabrizicola sp.]